MYRFLRAIVCTCVILLIAACGDSQHQTCMAAEKEKAQERLLNNKLLGLAKTIEGQRDALMQITEIAHQLTLEDSECEPYVACKRVYEPPEAYEQAYKIARERGLTAAADASAEVDALFIHFTYGEPISDALMERVDIGPRSDEKRLDVWKEMDNEYFNFIVTWLKETAASELKLAVAELDLPEQIAQYACNASTSDK